MMVENSDQNFLEFSFDEEVVKKADAKDRKYTVISDNFQALELCSLWVLAAVGNTHVCKEIIPRESFHLRIQEEEARRTCTLSLYFRKDSALQ